MPWVTNLPSLESGQSRAAHSGLQGQAGQPLGSGTVFCNSRDSFHPLWTESRADKRSAGAFGSKTHRKIFESEVQTTRRAGFFFPQRVLRASIAIDGAKEICRIAYWKHRLQGCLLHTLHSNLFGNYHRSDLYQKLWWRRYSTKRLGVFASLIAFPPWNADASWTSGPTWPSPGIFTQCAFAQAQGQPKVVVGRWGGQGVLK